MVSTGGVGWVSHTGRLHFLRFCHQGKRSAGVAYSDRGDDVGVILCVGEYGCQSLVLNCAAGFALYGTAQLKKWVRYLHMDIEDSLYTVPHLNFGGGSPYGHPCQAHKSQQGGSHGY